MFELLESNPLTDCLGTRCKEHSPWPTKWVSISRHFNYNSWFQFYSEDNRGVVPDMQVDFVDRIEVLVPIGAKFRSVESDMFTIERYVRRIEVK